MSNFQKINHCQTCSLGGMVNKIPVDKVIEISSDGACNKNQIIKLRRWDAFNCPSYHHANLIHSFGFSFRHFGVFSFPQHFTYMILLICKFTSDCICFIELIYPEVWVISMLLSIGLSLKGRATSLQLLHKQSRVKLSL